VTAIPLHREPAYTPLDKPGRCQTPGHEDQEARSYPGGRLCDPCISASRQSYYTSSDEAAAADG
jgi:hypothetical protein